MNADAPPGTSSSRQISARVLASDETRVWLMSNGFSVWTSITSHETPSPSSVAAASSAIAQHAPYVTTVASVPERSTSGTPSGTVNDPMLSGTRSFSR